MAVTDIMQIADFGMHYQKMRIDAATINIANANVVQPINGQGFKPLSVTTNTSFENTLFDKSQIQFESMVIDDKKIFQPEHPSADSQGFVHYANVDLAEQMVTMTQATRAYEANVKAFNAQMSMTSKSLEIGK